MELGDADGQLGLEVAADYLHYGDFVVVLYRIHRLVQFQHTLPNKILNPNPLHIHMPIHTGKYRLQHPESLPIRKPAQKPAYQPHQHIQLPPTQIPPPFLHHRQLRQHRHIGHNTVLKCNLPTHRPHKLPNMPPQLAHPSLSHQLPIVPQIEPPDQPVHFGVLVEMADVGVVGARVEDLQQGLVDCLRQVLEQGGGGWGGGGEQGLDAVFGDVGVGVLLDFVQD